MDTILAAIQWLLDLAWPSAGAYAVDADRVLGYMIPVLGIPPAIALASVLERKRPIENHDSHEARRTIHIEWALVAIMATLGIFVQILLFVAFGRGATIIGGPLFYIEPESVAAFVALAFIYALYIDCAKYWMHRISHMVPALWALHSFHHSAERLTVATGGRHHVIENLLLAPLLFIALMIFQVPEKVMAAAIVIMNIPEALQHLNYKLAWHRAGIWVNTPQWHRIHHSVEPQHVDKNFSSAFPVMDVIFGTAYIPEPDEYPDTGLRPLDNPSVLEGVMWPVRRWLPSRVSRDLDHEHISSARSH